MEQNISMVRNEKDHGMPDFLIVGAAKSGTTSLYYYMQQHPDIFLSTPKEPCFLALAGHNNVFAHERLEFITDYDEYRRLFQDAPEGTIKGEATALYLYHHEEVIKNAYKYIAEARKTKIIILLRNPIERAFSQYMMLVRDGREKMSFHDALKAERKRVHEGYQSDYHYIGRGMYFEQVKDFLDNFDDVKVMLFEEFIKDTNQYVRDIFDFLGVSQLDSFSAEGKFNVSGRPRYPLINRIVQSRNPVKKFILSFVNKKSRELLKSKIYKANTNKETMTAQDRAYLAEIYRSDIKQLSKLLNRNLDHWIE